MSSKNLNEKELKRTLVIKVVNDDFCSPNCDCLCLGICLTDNIELETFGLKYVRSNKCKEGSK